MSEVHGFSSHPPAAFTEIHFYKTNTLLYLHQLHLPLITLITPYKNIHPIKTMFFINTSYTSPDLLTTSSHIGNFTYTSELKETPYLLNISSITRIKSETRSHSSLSSKKYPINLFGFLLKEVSSNKKLIALLKS